MLYSDATQAHYVHDLTLRHSGAFELLSIKGIIIQHLSSETFNDLSQQLIAYNLPDFLYQHVPRNLSPLENVDHVLT